MHLFLDLVSVGVAVGGCMTGLVCDLKTRRIPNKLTGCLLLISLPLALTKAFFVESSFLWLYLMNFVFGFLAAFMLWRIRAWSGGDAKMFWALTALIPVYPDVFRGLFIQPPYYASYFFSITVLFNLALLLVLRFFIAAVYRFIKEKKTAGLIDLFIKPVSYLTASTLFAVGLFNQTGVPKILSSLAVICCLALIKRNSIMYPVSCVLAITGLIMSGVSDTHSLTSLLAANKTLFGFILLLSAYAAGSRIPLSRSIRIRDVKKGMSIAEEIYLREDVLSRQDASSPLRDLMGHKKRRPLVQPKPGGLTDEDIRVLDKYGNELNGAVKINPGFMLMPYLSMALTLSFFGDFLWLMLT